MNSFEVHSNESACRKKVRLGLEEVVGRGGGPNQVFGEDQGVGWGQRCREIWGTGQIGS